MASRAWGKENEIAQVQNGPTQGVTIRYDATHNVYYVKSCTMSDMFIMSPAPENQTLPDAPIAF